MNEKIDWHSVLIYWLEEAENDLKVAGDLFDKENYSYSLFFGHLAIEKLLKGYYVKQFQKHAPLIHNLERLAESSGLNMTEQQKECLMRISTFNIESRYPDIKRSFRTICTKEFTQKELEEVKEVYQWLKSVMK